MVIKTFQYKNSANVLEKLSLCNVKVDYKQYQKTMVTIPKDNTDYLLSFPMMGIKSTFLVIKATYKNKNPKKNFLKWKFVNSNDPAKSFTNILMFTGTASNPIEPILLDNPNKSCSVDLEILIAGVDNDYLDDVTSFLYLNDLKYDDVKTFNETTSETLEFFNSDGDSVGTTNTSEIINWYKIPNMNRIIIDESSNKNIILDFKTRNDALQALSAINWLMLDPQNRSLPKDKDIISPVITKQTNNIIIDLNTYPNLIYLKTDFINEAITSIVDNIDGPIIAIPQNIKFTNSSNVEVLNITSTDIYTGTITISDIAGNVSTETVTINASYSVTDTTPPVIQYTNDVDTISLTINDFDLTSNYGGLFTRNDAKVLCILSVFDNIDGPISLNDVTVNFYDSVGIVMSGNITVSGDYSIEFNASDVAGNQTINTFEIQIN